MKSSINFKKFVNWSTVETGFELLKSIYYSEWRLKTSNEIRRINSFWLATLADERLTKNFDSRYGYM